MNQKLKTVVLWGVLIVLVIFVIAVINGKQHVRDVPFSEFETNLNNGSITDVIVRGRKYIFTRKTDTGSEKLQSMGVEPDHDFNEKMMAANVKVTYQEAEEDGLLQSMLLSSIPVILLLAAFFIIMRQMQAGGGKAMSFGKSRAKMMSDHSKKVTFKDVAGIDEAREELEEIIDFLKDPKRFQRLGGRIPKGVLLMGGPGTGKTLLARAIAGEAGVPFYSISGSDFVEMFVGVGASRVRDLFEQGKKNAPCIVFIDEIDAVGRQRGAGLGGGHDEREQTLNQLLVEMDGFEENEGVIIVAATNRPDVLDPALLRPGRFDRRIVVPNPDVKGREGILKVHAKRSPISSSVDLLTLARATPGFSGADLENLVNEAALMAARRDKDVVEMDDFEDAKDKVMMGSERRSMIISDKDKKITAYHEAGHTIVARLIKGADPVHKVTIIPRGRALGLTHQLPVEDRLNLTKTYVLGKIAVLMGGRIAEELIFDELSTGAGQDIETATSLARRMVCEWGMDDKVGPLYLGAGQETVFLGREIGHQKEYSEKTSELIDSEVSHIINTQYKKARRILDQNRGSLKDISNELLITETIGADDINAILENRGAKSDEVVFEKKSSSTLSDTVADDDAPAG